MQSERFPLRKSKCSLPNCKKEVSIKTDNLEEATAAVQVLTEKMEEVETTLSSKKGEKLNAKS